MFANSVSPRAISPTNTRAVASPSITPSAIHGTWAIASARSESWIHMAVSTLTAGE